MRKPKILLIDDNEDFVECVKFYFEKNECDISVAYDGEEGLKLLEKEIPDCIILDLLMPNKSGNDVYMEVRNSYPTLPVIICTSSGLILKKARLDPFVRHLKKPFEMPELSLLLKELLPTKTR